MIPHGAQEQAFLDCSAQYTRKLVAACGATHLVIQQFLRARQQQAKLLKSVHRSGSEVILGHPLLPEKQYLNPKP